MANEIAHPCNPRVIAIEASNGCSLTRASILGMTPTDFEAQGFKEVGMDKIIANAQEAKAAGYIENTLEMLLMGRMAPIKGEIQRSSVKGQGSVILPYIYRRQKRNINSNYWRVTTGAASTGAGTGGLAASAWDLTVTTTGSTYATALTSLERYFLPGKIIHVETVNATTKAAYSLSFKIVTAVNADAGGVYYAKVTCVPNVTDTTWATYTAAQKAVYQPTTGTAVLLANNVSDYESWCYNEMAENNRKLLYFWLQRSRFTHQYSDEYLKALNAALTSQYFKDFRQLSLAEQKKIQYAKYMRDWVNACFYNQEIDENQAPTTYTSLPTVTDPADPSCTLEYKANAIGFKKQLINCSRYYDHQGNPLDLDVLFANGYDCKRAREATGQLEDRVDVMVDRWTAGYILQTMTSLYRAKYGVNFNLDFMREQTLSFGTFKALNYRIYPLPEDMGGYDLCVAYHSYFDDKIVAAASGDQQNRARTAWMLDWSDIELGIGEVNSRKRQTNEADNLYNCVIKANIQHYMLESTLWCPIIEDPSRHYLWDNFNNDCPTITVTACSV